MRQSVEADVSQHKLRNTIHLTLKIPDNCWSVCVGRNVSRLETGINKNQMESWQENSISWSPCAKKISPSNWISHQCTVASSQCFQSNGTSKTRTTALAFVLALPCTSQQCSREKATSTVVRHIKFREKGKDVVLEGVWQNNPSIYFNHLIEVLMPTWYNLYSVKNQKVSAITSSSVKPSSNRTHECLFKRSGSTLDEEAVVLNG